MSEAREQVIETNKALLEENKLLRYLLIHHQYKYSPFDGKTCCVQCGREKSTPCAKGCSIAVALGKPME